MSSSITSNNLRTGLIVCLPITVAIAVIGLWLPSLNRWRHQAARELRAESQGKSAQEAIGDYYASTLLEPHNQTAILTLSDMQLAIGDQKGVGETLQRLQGKMRAVRLAEFRLMQEDYTNSAVIAQQGLDRYGQSFELTMALAKAELELGHYPQALAAARQSLAIRASDVGAQTLYGLAGMLSLQQGNGNSDTPSLVTAPEATRRVARAYQDKVALAQELYALGLLNTSQAILAKLPPESTEVLKLKAQIIIARFNPSRIDLEKAAEYLATATKLNPADSSLWQLLVAVDQRLGDPGVASDTQTHLTRLQAGRP